MCSLHGSASRLAAKIAKLGESHGASGIRFATATILVVLTVSLLLPFLGKPLHVDDPLFVWCARSILAHPLNFYDFVVNWEGQPAPASSIVQNPPLAAYYLATFGRFLGWNEILLHSAFLLPGIAAVLGTYSLASKLSDSPLAAALAFLVSPVFIISATTLMCDTMMLAFWVWAASLWLQGVQGRQQWRFCAAAMLITAAALTKYFGICLVPLLFTYTTIKRRSLGWGTLWLMLPLAVMALYHLWTRQLYGRSLLLNAVDYATKLQVGGALSWKLLAGLSFTGGCIIIVPLAAPLFWGARAVLIAGAVALATALLLASLRRVGDFPLTDNTGAINWLYVIQISLFVVGGLSVLTLAAADLVRTRSPDSVLLSCWVVGVLVFSCVLNWTVSGRNILPMTPAVACLLTRRIEASPALLRINNFWLALPAGLSLALALLTAKADYDLAVSARETAHSLYHELSPKSHTVWFEGHWGFQYYMEQLGGKPLDQGNLKLAKGDAVIIPISNSYLFPVPHDLAVPLLTRDVSTSHWISTLNADAGAGFYSDGWGPMPFVFGRIPPARYLVLRAL